MAHDFYAPAASVSAGIGALNAEYAIISTGDAPFAVDLINNPPRLEKRPVRLVAEALTPELISAICQNHPKVALIDHAMFDPINEFYEQPLNERIGREKFETSSQLHAFGCKS